MQRRLTALYRRDARGRTTELNQWDGGTPPRFHLARTREGNAWLIRADVSDETAEALAALAADEAHPPDPFAAPRHGAAYLHLLGVDPAAPGVSSGPAYWFQRLPPAVPGTVAIGADNAHLLRGGLEAWLPDVGHRQPMVAMLQSGRAVAICASVRISAASHEAGVETLPSHRRRGFAAAVVSGWAHAARRRGVDTLFYSTSWDNVASQGVARRLGLTLIGTDFSVR
ncbi:MAG TPA: GNAT family N-acetyltransferase [Pseudomonadales bacterium]